MADRLPDSKPPLDAAAIVRQARRLRFRVRPEAVSALAGAYLQRARELGDVADYRRAELALRRSIGLYPSANVSAYLSLGSVQVGQHLLGHEVLRRVIRVPAPPDAPAEGSADHGPTAP